MAFFYFCKKCGGRAFKPMLKANKDKNGGLGTWRCDKCGVVSVKREKIQEKKEVQAAA
jgi:hypothetical protein